MTRCPSPNIWMYPNQKPWTRPELHAKLKARTTAFKWGNPETYSRYDLRKTIRTAQRKYREKLESSQQSHNPRCQWYGLRCITDYKGRSKPVELSIALLTEKLNTFYTCFDADNTTSITRPQTWRELRAVLTNLPGSSQTSLTCLWASLPTMTIIFKTSTVVRTPKTPTISCLRDYRRIALTCVIMKCFKQIAKNASAALSPTPWTPYRAKRSTDNAIALAFHTSLSHLERENT